MVFIKNKNFSLDVEMFVKVLDIVKIIKLKYFVFYYRLNFSTKKLEII